MVQKGPHNAALSCAQPQKLSQLPKCLLMCISRFVGIIQVCSAWHGHCTINKACHSHSMMGRKRYAEQLPSLLCFIHQQFQTRKGFVLEVMWEHVGEGKGNKKECTTKDSYGNVQHIELTFLTPDVSHSTISKKFVLQQ